MKTLTKLKIAGASFIGATSTAVFSYAVGNHVYTITDGDVDRAIKAMGVAAMMGLGITALLCSNIVEQDIGITDNEIRGAINKVVDRVVDDIDEFGRAVHKAARRY